MLQKKTKNGQKATKSIFQYFQLAADKIVNNFSILIYPGSRWIHRSGKGMDTFGLEQINDKKLKKVIFYPNGKEVFPTTEIADGISIVVKQKNKTSDGFEYVYKNKNETITVHIANPGNSLIPLYPRDMQLTDKINNFIQKNKLSYLSESVLPRSLFNIESDFVEKNPKKVELLKKNSKIDYERQIKLFTNDKAGKAGRATWFITDKTTISSNKELISEWQVVVSSASPGGQKRDKQLEIIDNHSAFGRSRVALKSFRTEREANNFYKYMQSDFIKFTLLMTDENLTSFAKKVPDIMDYSDKNNFIDFEDNVDNQLCKLIGISYEEFSYMKQRIKQHN